MKNIILVSLVSLVLVGFGGCPPRVEPQILALNYVVQTVPTPEMATALIDSVRGGQMPISTLLTQDAVTRGPRDPCNFTADFTNRTPPTAPKIVVNGTPGQTGFNVTIGSTTPVAIQTTNPSSCQALKEIEILIGGRSEALALRTQTNRTKGRVALVNNQDFNTSEFFQAQVLSFDPTNRRTSGEFRFINREPGSTTMLIVEGSFGMKP